MSFITQRIALTKVPLNGPKGEEWATVLGGAQDAEMVQLRTAGIARSVTRTPDDALDDLGSLYSLPRAPREGTDATGGSSDAYRARLARVWSFRGQAPLTSGIVALLGVYSSSTAQVYSGGAAGAPAAWFSEFTIVWPNTDFNAAMADSTWGDLDFDGNASVWGDGGLWGLAYVGTSKEGSFGIVDLDWLKRQLRAIKGAQAYPTVLYLGLGVDAHGSSGMWGDGGAWGDGGVWGDPATSVVRIILGHTWSEETMFGVVGPGLWGTPGDVWDTFEPPTGGW